MSELIPSSGEDLKSSNQISFIKRKLFLIIQIKGSADQIGMLGINRKINSIYSHPQSVIIDCVFLTSLPASWINSFYYLKQHLSFSNCFLLFIHCNDELKNKLAVHNLINSSWYYPNFYDVTKILENLQKNPMVPPKLSPQQSLSLSSIKALTILTKQSFYPKELSFKQSQIDQFMGDYSSICLVKSQQRLFSLAITFPLKTFNQVLNKLYGKFVEQASAGQLGIINQFLSEIIKFTKLIFFQQNKDFNATPPFFISDKNYPEKMNFEENAPDFSFKEGTKALIPFMGPWGKFSLELIFPPSMTIEEVNQYLKG